MSQPSTSSGTKSAVLTISARPYDVDQISVTPPSSVSARPRPLTPSTHTDASATVENRATIVLRSSSSGVARGRAKTSATSPPNQTAAESVCARSTGTARTRGCVAVEGVPRERRRHDQHGCERGRRPRACAGTPARARRPRRPTSDSGDGDAEHERVARAGGRVVDDAAPAQEHRQHREEEQVGDRPLQPRSEDASREQPEAHDADTDEEAEVGRACAARRCSRQAGSRRRAPAAAAPVPHRRRRRARPARDGRPARRCSSGRCSRRRRGCAGAGGRARGPRRAACRRVRSRASCCSTTSLPFALRIESSNVRRTAARRGLRARRRCRAVCARASRAPARSPVRRARRLRAGRRGASPRARVHGSPLLALPIPCPSTSTSARTGTCSRSSTA